MYRDAMYFVNEVSVLEGPESRDISELCITTEPSICLISNRAWGV